MTQYFSPLKPLFLKLKGFVPLSEMDHAALENLITPIESVPAHADLIHEGDKPKGVLLILDGMAYRYKMRTDGSRQIVAYLLPGDTGDLDVDLLHAFDHSIGTFSACKVMWIKPDALQRVWQNYPMIAKALRMSTLVDEATLREWLLNVGRRKSIERLAHLFFELLLRLQVIGLASENCYALPISQWELADTTGMTHVHVNRSLMELRRRGLIDLKGRTLTILKQAELKALAEFRPDYLHIGQRRAA